MARRRARRPRRRSSWRGTGAPRRWWRGPCASSAPSSATLSVLREAAELAARSGSRLELAKALVAEGAALRAARRPTAARDPLRQGLELATALGADALAVRARQELYAAGGRPRTTALQGADALTPSERRVAERAAAGQTNRAIAEALFVTPKTVELHLRNAYRKLGAKSRHELAGLFEGEPVSPRS